MSKKTFMLGLKEILTTPPGPYTEWSSGAIKKWLQNEGCDFSKPISRQDTSTIIYFTQYDTEEELKEDLFRSR